MHNSQSAQISMKQDGHNIYVIVKTMCPPSHHHNGFVATHALGYIKPYIMCPTQVHELSQSHCGDIWEDTLFSCIYIY